MITKHFYSFCQRYKIVLWGKVDALEQAFSMQIFVDSLALDTFQKNIRTVFTRLGVLKDEYETGIGNINKHTSQTRIYIV